MRSLLRFSVFGCALALTALPLAYGGAGSVAAAASPSSPATVSAANWTNMANSVATPGSSTQAGAVSCVSSAFCVAVTGIGGEVDGLNGGQDYAELWNGTTWSPMTLPTVTGATSTTLVGVSCVTSSFCVAVGHATGVGVLIEQWNGSTWTVATTSLGQASDLLGVSCTSATFCQAVGNASGLAPVAAQWNGSTWSAQTLSLPGGDTSGDLVATSCTTPTFCMATGSGLDQSIETPIAYSWNGSTWTSSAIANGTSLLPLLGVVCRTDLLRRHGVQPGSGQRADGLERFDMVGRPERPDSERWREALRHQLLQSDELHSRREQRDEQRGVDLGRPVVDAGKQPALRGRPDRPKPSCSASTA